MRSSYLFSLLFVTSLSAVTIEDINSKPTSLEKNFLIWQFLRQDINASQASEAFYQIDTVNERFLFDYSKKTDEIEIRYTVECIQQPAPALLSLKNDDCLYLALNPQKAEKLERYEREIIAERLGNKYGNVQWLRVMNNENFFLPEADTKLSLELFLNASLGYRHKYFNHTIDSKTLGTLTTLKGFDDFVYHSITDPKLIQLQISLSDVGGGTYSPQTHFYLGINALKYNRQDNAIYHFKQAKLMTPNIIDRDKNLFWLYMSTLDASYLQSLSESLDINMYTLWSREKLSLPTENYFTTLPTSDKEGFKGDDPFEWNRLKQKFIATPPEELYKLIDQYDSKDSIAVQAFMIERAYLPYIHNFTMPYDNYMEDITTDQKAMLYALMRQETRLIPGLISRSFALGLMQIMPFNVDTISKTHPLKITSYVDMFNPKYGISYSIEHMKHIDKTLFNPVLKAYAYNGGIGFTRRLLLAGEHFNVGKFEPFMSMELINNAESREYGKKVLANYIIYKKILGEPVSISAIFDNLIQPSQSDYFRAEGLKLSALGNRSE